MKRYLFGRGLGVLLAGILLVESSIPVFAVESGENIQQNIEIAEISDNTSSTEGNNIDAINLSEEEEVSQTQKPLDEEKPEQIQKAPEEKPAQTQKAPEEEDAAQIQQSFEQEESLDTLESSDEEADEAEVEEENAPEENVEHLSKANRFALQRSIEDDSILAAPQKLTVKRGAKEAELTWETVEGATAYRVYRRDKATDEFILQGNGAITTDSNLVAYKDIYQDSECKTTFYYKVCAVKSITDEADNTIIREGTFSDIIESSAEIKTFSLDASDIAINKGGSRKLNVSFDPDFVAELYSVEWNTSEPTVATIDNGEVLAVGAGTAVITAMVENFQATCNVTVNVPLQKLAMEKEEMELAKGESAKIAVIVSPDDVTENVELTWSSSNENIIQVTPNKENTKRAEITAVGTGEAVVTVKTGKLSAECAITVLTPTVDIELSEDTVQLLKEDDSVNVGISITPADAMAEIRYVVENEDLIECELGDRVLSISSKGVVGETNVRIYAGGQTAVLKVQVREEKQKEEILSNVVSVSDIEIDATWNSKEDENTVKGAINLWLDEEAYTTAMVTAKIIPEQATNKQIVWSSSDISVVTVDGEGVVKATGVGRASILATADNGVSASITVVVLPATSGFNISSSKEITLYCNDDLPAIANNASRTSQIILSKQVICDYHSSNDKVATVDGDGLITAQEPGSATISVIGKANGEVKKVNVTVKRIVEDIRLPYEEITVIKGTTPEITYSMFPEKASIDSVNSMKVGLANSSSEILEIDKNMSEWKTNGTIRFRAIKEGTERIYIKAGDTYYDEENNKVAVTSVKKELIVHVVDTQNLRVGSMKLTGSGVMKSGTQQTLTAVVKDKNGNELDSSQIDIAYSSSDEKVAMVDSRGTISAMKGGKAVITAYVMNGSNAKTTYSITVEQRPEEILFDRTVYGIIKAANRKASVTVKPRFAPADTKDKRISWSISEVLNEDGSSVSGNLSDYFTVDAYGKVTAAAITTNGMKAVVKCTSNAYQANEEQVIGYVTVVVQEKKVSAIKFDKSTLEVVGIAEHMMPFYTTFVNGYSETEYETFTSDAAIATAEIEDGHVVLTAHKYGTVTVTLCADHSITTTCKVTIYPVAKGQIVSKEASYLLQQAQYKGNDKVQLHFVDAKTKKEIIDPSLFVYESSAPDIVYVDAQGVAYANPAADGKITAKNSQVTITATLKDDPTKRKVKTKVIVCPDKQVERLDVIYYETTGKAAEDKNNVKGQYLADKLTGMGFSGSGQKYVLRTIAFGSHNDAIQNAKLAFVSSDKTLAEVVSQTKKTFTSEDGTYEAWEIVIAVKKPGRFSISITSQDQKKYARSVAFAAYSAKPIVTENNIGTINRYAEVVSIDEKRGIPSNGSFTVLGADGTEVRNVAVKSARIKLKSTGKMETVPNSKLTVQADGNNRYHLVMLESAITDYVDGTYSVMLAVERTLLGSENSDGWGNNETITENIESTFTIVSSQPKLQTANVTLNSFLKNDTVKIPINSTAQIENVSIAPGMQMARELEVFQQGKSWYVGWKEDAFDNWKKTKTSGVLLVKLEGYKKPVEVNLNVTCKSIKPIVKQAQIPTIQLRHGAVTTAMLVNGQKEQWKDYTIIRKDTTSPAVFQVERQEDDETRITFTDPSMKLKSQGVTLTEKVVVKKDEWRSPIETTISVKVYNGDSVPKITFVNGTVSINKKVGETSAETITSISHSNVVLKEGEWSISDACKYKTVENGKTVWHQVSEAFVTEYKEGTLKISLRKADIPKGTYKLIMTNLWDSSFDPNPEKPLQTATLTVVVKDVDPIVNIKMSGKIDLVKRGMSTLQGTVSVSNMNSSIRSIRLVNTNDDGFADKFYCVRKNNTFTVYARSNATLTTKKVTGTVEITMNDGNMLRKTISFTPSQSTPKVIDPEKQTIYKSAIAKTVDYNFNEKLPQGVRISHISAVKVPDGLQVQDDNGHLYVTLGNKTLKQGKYMIEVNVYLKGAQAIVGDALGKPVKKRIYVEVRE